MKHPLFDDYARLHGIDNDYIANELARHGFTFEQTGGNCTAYVRLSDDGEIEEMITLKTDPRAPEHLEDVCHVGSRSLLDDAAQAADWDSGKRRAYNFPEEATVAEILRALNHPSDEYALLELRLYSGLGDEDADYPCAACAREHGPHYKGECEHGN